MNAFSKDVGSDFLSSASLAQVTLSERWKGVEGNQDVDRTEERSQPDDSEEYWQSRELCGNFKTVFSFTHHLELSHVLNIILVNFRKGRPSLIWTQQFYF